jgi:hypothetical protein
MVPKIIIIIIIIIKLYIYIPHTLGYRGVNFGTTFDQHKIVRHRFKSRMDVVQGSYQRVIYPNLK